MRKTGPELRIKGQKYNLLSRWENLTIGGKQALKLLFRAHRRLNKASLLKQSFGQLWDYNRPGWARRFFNNWKDVLKWQRLGPFRKFAAMVERTGTASRRIVTWRTRCLWASLKESTTRSVSFNNALTATVTRSISG